jgi:hypothetical protein
MTPLEKQLLADGFRILLLRADWCPERGRAQWQAVLCDGGRPLARATAAAPGAVPAPALAELRRLLRDVLAPPHLLAGIGPGWRRLVGEQMPEVAGLFRTLDLWPTATGLAGMSPRSPPEAVLATLTGAPAALTDDGGTAWAEELLWAAVSAAGRHGLSLTGLLAVVAEPRAAAAFAAAAEPLAPETFPERPGVYLMRGAGGRVLYIGKAANLARRLGDYLHASWQVPLKLQALRSEVRRIEHRVVGSELEALLLEQRLIRECQPVYNVQRELDVREAPEAYGWRHALAIVTPSTRAGRAELFFAGPERPALQLSCDPRRWPRRTLLGVLTYYAGTDADTPPPRCTANWGLSGGAVCRRYFRRFHHALHWLELPAQAAEAAAGVEALRQTVESARADPAGAEFRLPAV